MSQDQGLQGPRRATFRQTKRCFCNKRNGPTHVWKRKCERQTAGPRRAKSLQTLGRVSAWEAVDRQLNGQSRPAAAASRLQKERGAGRAGFPVLANCDRAKSPANRLPAATSICAPAARPSHPRFPRTQAPLGRPCRPLSPAPPPGSRRPGSRSRRRRTTLTISCLRM